MAGISKKKIKTKGGKEVIKYTITYRDVFGKQHTNGYYDTLKEAKKDLGKFENINPDVKNVTYGMIFNEFLKKAQNKYAKSTYEDYSRNYNRFFSKISEIGYYKINSLEWQKYFDDILKESSPYVTKSCLKMAKAAANYAKKHELIEDNIFDKVEPIELPKADINHLTIEELKMALAECKKTFPQYYALFYTFIGTGARQGEIFALTKDDFSYQDKTLKICKQYTKGQLLPHPKTSHSNRLVYLFDELAEILKRHIQTLEPNNNLLFPNKKGNYHNVGNFKKYFFSKLLKLCKIKKRVRVHDLRGSYIDMTQAKGIPIKFTQHNVGHSRCSTTLDVYNQNSPDMINFAQNTINNVFEKCEQNVSKRENLSNKKIIYFPKKPINIRY